MPRKSFLLILFLFTGFVGVLAEQVFERLLSSVVGGTTPASAMVLVAYFGALAAGGCAAAKILSRPIHPLRAYGYAELGVALCCLFVLARFDNMAITYAPLLAWGAGGASQMMLARLTVAVTVVFPAAFCMGLSFPFLGELASRVFEQPAAFLARLYTVNLLGAALAALAAPYILFPRLGLSGGLALCSAVDLVVGGLSLATSLRPGFTVSIKSDAAASDLPRLRAAHMPVLTVAFVSGLTFFSLEVVWTHLVGVVINSTTYAFSSMLFFCIVGLGLGARVVANRLAEDRSPASLGMLFVACASLTFIQTWLWPYVPVSLAMFGHSVRNFYAGEALRWLHLAVLLLPVTVAYGMIYPSLFQERRFGGQGAGALLGYMGTLNAIGCVCGAALSSFVLIPVLGGENTLKAAVIALVLCGLTLFAADHEIRQLKGAVAGALAAGVILFSAPGWNRLLLTSGLNVYFRADSVMPTSKLLFFHEDASGGITTVVENSYPGGRTGHVLLTNGKFQGIDLGAETEAQLGFTAIPAMHLSHTDDGLIIGLGTGHSAGMLKKMGFGSIDIVELSPGIVAAAKQHFSGLNDRVLEDRETTVYVEDGRNLLLTRNKKYDLISIEISSVWFAGATNVYSQGFYATARRRLKPGGVLQQWVQLHHISPVEVESIIGTIRAVFPHVSLWLAGGQGIIVASDHRHRVEDRGLKAVSQALVFEMKGHRDAAARMLQTLRGSQLMDCEDVDQMVRLAHPRINNDWNRFLEYATPRYNLSDADWPGINYRRLSSYAAAARHERARVIRTTSVDR